MKPKLFIFITVLSILSWSVVSSQSAEVRFLIDTSIVLMKKNSVNAGKVDWESLHSSVLKKAAGITDVYQLGAVISDLYQAVEDFHGSFFYKDSTFRWHNKEFHISDSIMNEWKKGPAIKTRLLDKQIGYLRVPSMPYPAKADADIHAQMLNDSLCTLLNQNIKGLVLDLRLDGGGSMYPMILGLEQLLSPGKKGSFTAKDGQTWYLKDNNFLLDSAVLASITPKCNTDARHIPLVILIGPGTGSSGEFLVMAISGRQKTTLLGSATAGYITSVAGFPINEAAYMYLSTGYGADSQGKVYTRAIEPDITGSGPDRFNDIANDEKVKAAVAWLKKTINE